MRRFTVFFRESRMVFTSSDVARRRFTANRDTDRVVRFEEVLTPGSELKGHSGRPRRLCSVRGGGLRQDTTATRP
jgi:hypothetical protein